MSRRRNNSKSSKKEKEDGESIASMGRKKKGRPRRGSEEFSPTPSISLDLDNEEPDSPKSGRRGSFLSRMVGHARRNSLPANLNALEIKGRVSLSSNETKSNNSSVNGDAEEEEVEYSRPKSRGIRRRGKDGERFVLISCFLTIDFDLFFLSQ